MISFFYDSFLSFLVSLFPGIMIGVFYDIFRIMRIGENAVHSSLGQAYNAYMPKRRKIRTFYPIHKMVSLIKSTSVFAQDILFWIIAGCVEILFVFYIYNGEIRIYSMIVSFLGFLLYYQSVGKFVFYFAKHIYLSIKLVIGWVFYGISFPLVHLIRVMKLLVNSIYRKTIYCWILKRTYKKLYLWNIKKKEELLLSALNGFGREC